MSARPSLPDVLPLGAEQELRRRADAFHAMLASWLDVPGITLACGRWSEGVISEMVPVDGARLLPERYEGVFVGVRELRLVGAPHHLHIDLARVERFRFTLAPSVCLGFKPSFEIRLLTRDHSGKPSGNWLLSLMLSAPYVGGQLDQAAARDFLERACAQLRQHPDLTEIVVDEQVRETPAGRAVLPLLRELAGPTVQGCNPQESDGQACNGKDSDAGIRNGQDLDARSCDMQDWDVVLRALHPPRTRERSVDEPPVLALLRRALRLPDAALVIHRDQVLIEFQTTKLDGVHRYEAHGHVSWQIGAQHLHHCHLRLEAVDTVLFSAEASPCQGGALNYTVWFNTSKPSGNPFRPEGYFSVTLNRPYANGRPRAEVIEPVLALYRSFSAEPWVAADETFLHVLAEGPPARLQRSFQLQEDMS